MLPKDEWSYTDQLSTVPPDFETTIVYDVKGKRVAIDAYIDYYFVGTNYTRTIYVKADGTRYIKDYGINALSSDEGKEVSLAEFIWSIYNINPLSNSYVVAQKKADLPGDPCDYRVRNLEVVRKPKTLTEQREQAARIQASRKKRSA